MSTNDYSSTPVRALAGFRGALRYSASCVVLSVFFACGSTGGQSDSGVAANDSDIRDATINAVLGSDASQEPLPSDVGQPDDDDEELESQLGTGGQSEDRGQQASPGALVLMELDVLNVPLGSIRFDLDTLGQTPFLEGLQPKLHPSGKFVYAAVCRDGLGNRVVLYDRQTDERVDLTECSEELWPNAVNIQFRLPELSPSGRYLATDLSFSANGFGRPDRHYVAVFDLQEGGKPVELEYRGNTWTPDERLILSSATMGGVFISDPPFDQVESLNQRSMVRSTDHPAVHPEGHFLVFEYDDNIYRLDMDGTSLQLLDEYRYGLSFPAFVADASLVAYLEGPVPTRVRVVNVSTGDIVVIDAGPGLGVQRLSGPISWLP